MSQGGDQRERVICIPYLLKGVKRRLKGEEKGGREEGEKGGGKRRGIDIGVEISGWLNQRLGVIRDYRGYESASRIPNTRIAPGVVPDDTESPIAIVAVF